MDVSKDELCQCKIINVCRSSLSGNVQNQVFRPCLKTSLSYRKLCMNARRHTFLAFTSRPPEARLKAMVPFIKFSLRDFYVFSMFTWVPPCLHLKFIFFTLVRNHCPRTFMKYRKVANSSLSRLVARFQIFRRLMKGKFDAYVL